MTKIFNKKTGALSALSATLLLAVIIPSMPFAYAGDEICDANLTGTIDGNVIVPAGETCIIFNATVNGNVLGEGIIFIVNSEVHGSVQNDVDDIGIQTSEIHGSVQSDGGGDVFVVSSTVDGDVEVKEIDSVIVLQSNIDGNVKAELVRDQVFIVQSDVGGDVDIKGGGGFAALDRNNMGIVGNIQIEEKTVGDVSITNNIVGTGNIKVTKNTGARTIVIFSNTIDNGDIQVEENAR